MTMMVDRYVMADYLERLRPLVEQAQFITVDGLPHMLRPATLEGMTYIEVWDAGIDGLRRYDDLAPTERDHLWWDLARMLAVSPLMFDLGEALYRAINPRGSIDSLVFGVRVAAHSRHRALEGGSWPTWSHATGRAKDKEWAWIDARKAAYETGAPVGAVDHLKGVQIVRADFDGGRYADRLAAWMAA